LLLQEKLNRYLALIESGELFEKFPDAKGQKLILNIMGKYPLSKQATFFSKRPKII